MEQLLYASLVLLPFGVSLRMSLRLLYGARGPQTGDPVHLVIHSASWALTIIPLLVFIIIGTSWLSWFVLVVTAIAGLEFVLARRSMQRHAAWELLTGAIGSRKPEVSSLQSHQGRFTGIVGRAFRRLVASLQQGVPLRQAIGQHRRALPEEAQIYAAIDALSEANSCSPNSRTMSRDSRDADAMINVAGQQLYQRYTYLSTLLVVMLAVVTFLSFRIIPSYKAIFQDFDLELPAITKLLISIGDLLDWYVIGVPGVLLLVCILLAGILLGVLYLCDLHVLRPITDRLFFSRHRTQILRLFAIAAERGQPFQEVLSKLIDGRQSYPSRFAVSRLSAVQQQINAGTDWKLALQTASIIKPADIPMLETAQQAGNLPWVLRMLADQKTRSMIFRWTAIEQIVFPLEVALIGIVVLFVCVALFMPLVQLIHDLV